MPKRGFWLIFLLALLVFANSSPVKSQTTDEMAIRKVVERMFAAFAKNDIEGVMECWSRKSPQLEEFRRFVTSQLADITGEFSINVKCTRWWKGTEGEIANRLWIEIKWRDGKTKAPRETNIIRHVVFVKETGSWKWSRVTDSVQDVAYMLIRARSRDERSSLLKEDKELVNGELAITVKEAGNAQSKQGNFSEALRLNGIAFEVADLLDDKSERAWCYLYRGFVFFDQSRNVEALDEYQTALGIFRQIHSKQGEGAALNAIGNVHQSAGEYDKALIAYQTSLNIGDDLHDKAIVLSNIGNVHVKKGDYVEGLRALDESRKILLELGDRSGEAMVQLGIGGVFAGKGQHAKAVETFETALKLFRQLGMLGGQAKALGNIASVCAEIGEYQRGIEACEESLKIKRVLGDKEGEAGSLVTIGDIHSSRGEYAKALYAYDLSLGISRMFGYKPLQASALDSVGNAHLLFGQYAKALQTYESGIQIKREMGDHAGEAHTLNNIGEVYRLTGRYQKALETYLISLQISRQFGMKKVGAMSLRNIGLAHMQLGNYNQAIDDCNASLKVARELHDRIVELTILDGLATVHSHKGNYQRALELFNTNLVTYHELGMKAEEATTWVHTGNVYSSMGHYAGALESFEKSMQLSILLGNRVSEKGSLTGMGLALSETGKYADALMKLFRALEMSESMGDNAGKASGLLSIGGVYALTGRYSEAKSVFEAGLRAMREMGMKAGEATALIDIGMLYSLTGEYPKALTALDESLKISDEIGDKINASVASNNVGVLLLDTGHWIEALPRLEASLEVERETGNKAGEATALCNISAVYVSMRNFEQAQATSELALKISESIGTAETAFRCWFNIGTAYQERGQLNQSADAYRKSIALIEQIRSAARVPSLKIGFFQQHTRVYHRLARCVLELDPLGGSSLSEVLTISEQAKARTLVDIIHNAKIDIFTGLTKIERENEERLKTTETTLEAQLNNGRFLTTDRELALKRQLENARAEYEAFRLQLSLSHPEIQTLRGEFKPATLTHLSQSLFAKEPNLALLSYLVGDDATILFVVTRGTDSASPATLTVYRLPLKENELKARVERFSAQCGTAEDRKTDYRESARDLYESLIAPAEKELTGKTHVVIVPDGELHMLPFQALMDNRGKHLIEKLAVSYAPSATALIEMVKLADNRKTKPANELVAFGISQFGEGFGPLPEAEKAVKSIGELFGDRAVLFLGEKATEATAKAEMGKARYVHFATHAVFNRDAAMYSYLVLTKDSNNDGFLHAQELLNMDLSADLVVLDACKTAEGHKVKGEGLLGLTWALFVAGTPSSIVTQWQIADDSSRELMVEFYKRLLSTAGNGRGIGKAEALRQAQLKLMKDGKHAHPYYWAPFVLVGDWR